MRLRRLWHVVCAVDVVMHITMSRAVLRALMLIVVVVLQLLRGCCACAR